MFMNKYKVLLLSWMAIAMTPLCLPAGSERVLSVFDFATTEAARAAWKPASGVSPVGLFNGIVPIEKPGVRFPCNFSAMASRCYWDRTISEDFTNDTMIILRIYIEIGRAHV